MEGRGIGKGWRERVEGRGRGKEWREGGKGWGKGGGRVGEGWMEL